MTVWSHLSTIFNRHRFLYFSGFVALIVALMTTILLNVPAYGVEGVNKTIGFQGRLQQANGGIVPDGHYNIQFKIYQDGSGVTAGNPDGTLKWTESYVNNNGTSGVRVKNGYFSVDLGSKTAFGSSVDWNQDSLWISMNIAGIDTACTTFGTAPCAADGEMLPMKRLTATPYALNADKLDGKDASDFIQNQNGVQQTASNFWISGTGRADTLLQAPAIDTATGVALNIGTTNATSINLNQSSNIAANKNLTFSSGSGNFDQSLSTGTLKTGTGAVSLNGDTTIASGKTLTVNGNTLIKPATGSASALQVQNTAGASVFNVSNDGGTTVSLGNTSGGIGYTGHVAGGTYGAAISTTQSASVLKPVPVGHTLIGSLTVDSTGAAPDLSVTDSKGNTYTIDATANNTSTAVTYIFSSHLTTALSTSDTITMTITGGGKTRWAWNLESFDNIASTNRLDKTSSNTGATTFSMSSGATATTSDASELVFGAFGYSIASGRVITPGNGFSNSPQQATSAGTSDRGNYVEWKTVSSTGAQTASATSTTQLTWSSAVATYRTTGPPGAGTLGLSDGSGNTAVINTTNLSENRTYTLPDESGTICIQNSANCGFLQNQNATDQSAHFRIGGTGSISSDSTSAFAVQNTSGAKQLNVDNTNNRISIGTSDTSGTTLVLDTKTNAGDPTGVSGAMYYNSNAGKFRCYENGSWKDCITSLPSSVLASTDTTNATTTPVDVQNMSFGLAANTKYYYKFVIKHASSTTGAGIGFGTAGLSANATNTWCVSTISTRTSSWAGQWGSYCGSGDASASTTGVETQGENYTSTMEGYVTTGATTENLKLRMKSSTNIQVSAKQGSFGILQVVQ